MIIDLENPLCSFDSGCLTQGLTVLTYIIRMVFAMRKKHIIMLVLLPGLLALIAVISYIRQDSDHLVRNCFHTSKLD